MVRFFTGLVCLLLTTYNIFAQQPCATLQIQSLNGTVIPCDSPVRLVPNITFPQVFNTDQYTGSVIPFAPEPWIGANTIIANTDDVWSDTLSLPFPFCFFGQVYNKIIVGSNGVIGFDITQATLTNNWSSWNGGPPNNWICPINNITLNNTIMGPYHDIDPGISGNISWDINGIAPCRRMVVNFTSVPMFQCNALIDTQQIVIYEMTNNIDINIKDKPVCSTWNGGIAHEGIQNATGTVAYMTPGRNGTIWTANNDSYRFTPSGAPTPITYTYTWIDSATNTVIGNSDTLIIPPPVTLSGVICQVNISGGCLPYSFADTIHLTTGSVVADFSMENHLGCDQDTVCFTNLTSPSIGTSYYWTFGDPSTPSVLTDPCHVYYNQIPFYVTLIATNSNCIPDTVIKQINIAHPLKAVITAQAGPIGFVGDSVCLGDWFKAIASSSLPGVIGVNYPQFEWNWGDGSAPEYGILTNPSGHVYANSGTYTLTLIVTDSIGCKDTATHLLYVDPPAFEDFYVSDSLVCVGDPVIFYDTVAPNAIGFLWDFGDGKTLPNMHMPTHVYDMSGLYVVTLTSYYAKCPPHTTTRQVVVEDYPLVSLGADTSICPGITGTIVLNNQINPNEVMHWSTGQTSNAISITESGHYWAEATSPNGICKSTDSIWIQRDCYINIPNAFSPNEDGLNDYFFPRELLSSGVKVFRMNIYNRWGENIFTTTSINGRGWDGKYNGKLQNMGAYVYIMDVEFVNGVKKTFKGNVTLMK